jgi:hypothetical protein
MSGTVSDNTSQSSGSVTAAAGGISILGSDPTLTEGLLWYNSSSNTLKVARTISAWSTENSLLSSVKALGGAGTVDAGLSFGGTTSHDPTVRTTETEEFDGTSWSVTGVGNLTTASAWGAAFGTQTAAVYAGGQGADNDRTEEYNGTTWTTGGNLQEGQNDTAGFGTLTAGVRFGGEN